MTSNGIQPRQRGNESNMSYTASHRSSVTSSSLAPTVSELQRRPLPLRPGDSLYESDSRSSRQQRRAPTANQSYVVHEVTMDNSTAAASNARGYANGYASDVSGVRRQLRRQITDL